PESRVQVIDRHRPDVLLPTLGGQTALNLAVALAESGDLERLGVGLIGAGLDAIHRAEDRSGFKETMSRAGVGAARAGGAGDAARGERALARPRAGARGGARVPGDRPAVVHARRRRERVRPR